MSLAQKLDPRVKRTRQLLERSFLEMLEEKSFQSITIRDITDRATVNRATFYAHFEDKQALLDHTVRESFQEALHSNLPPGSEFSLDNLRVLIVTVCEFLEAFNEQRHSASAKQLGPLIEEEVQNQVYDRVLRWISLLPTGSAERPAAPEIMASAISGAILGAGGHWRRDGRGYSAQEISDQVLSLIVPSLAAPRAVEIPERAVTPDRPSEVPRTEPHRARYLRGILARDIRRDRLKAATRPWRSDNKD